ncbi:MAG TPA: DinB family protein [Roseiflexaceae bacterium]|nr:DinB family protein [Roseiflexaceae bacterium]
MDAEATSAETLENPRVIRTDFNRIRWYNPNKGSERRLASSGQCRDSLIEYAQLRSSLGLCERMISRARSDTQQHAAHRAMIAAGRTDRSTAVNADAFRHFYNYHFAENRTLWDYVAQLSHEQFTQQVGYSHGSVRDQIVHLMSVDDIWFSELQGMQSSEPFPLADFDDRQIIRAHWDSVEQRMRYYLAEMRDDMLFDKPIEEPEEDKDLIVWQVLIHVVNHGTDHRAQLLRLLNDLGVKTTSQDYIFYVYSNPQ